MRKRARVLGVLIFFLFFCFHLCASGGKQLAIPETIRIVGDLYYPPYEMLGENGEPQGFCIDLVKEIMKRMNKDYTIQLMTRQELLQKLKSGKADLGLEMTYTDDRAKFLHFGTIYNYAFKGVLYRDGDTPITSFEQIEGKTVGVEANSFSENLLRNSRHNLKIYPIGKLAQSSELLKQHKCDLVFCNLDIANYIVQHTDGLKSSDVGLPPEKFCMASPIEKLQTKIDFIVYDLKKDGTYDKLAKKWLKPDRAEYYLHIFYVSLGVFVCLILGFSMFSLLLHLRVKKAKEELEHDRRSLSLSLHAGDIGIWGYDVEKKKFYNVFCNYFPPEGRSYRDEIKLFHPDDLNVFTNAIRMASTGNPPQSPIVVRMDHSGKKNWRYIEKEIHCVYDNDGKARVIGTHKDVSARIVNEKKIKELLNDHEIIFNHNSVGIQYFDAEGNLVRMNDAACKIFGIKDKMAFLAVKPNLFKYSEFKHYIDKDNLHNDHFIMNCKLGSDDEYKQYISISGNRYIETYISPVYDSENNLISIIMNNSDLTEQEMLRKKVDDYAERMKYILKASGVITWTYNPNDHLIKSFYEKENKSSSLTMEKYLEFVDEEDKDAVKELIMRMDKRSIDSFNIRARYFKAFGKDSSAYYSIDGKAVKDKDGKIINYLGLGMDISELMEIQHNLQHEKMEAQKADRLKSAFLANMSHEIRTPLNAIVGFSNLLLDSYSEEEKKQFVEIIKTSNDQLLKIIGDVLDLSKIESGTMKYKIEQVDLEQLFCDFARIFSKQLEDSPVKIIYEKSHEEYLFAMDRQRLTQVLTNFMTNAVKYTREGQIRLGYECMDGGVKFFVEDTGLGIPMDKKERVFDRFEKLDSFVQGTGLGLSICKDIATMFHGKIGVESELGRGSTFWMWLPGECNL